MVITDRDGRSYVVFDAHTHMGRRPIKSQVSASDDLSTEEKLAEMDRAGVDLAVVFPRANPHTDYREANYAVIEAMKLNPTRLVAYARMHPYFKARAVADLGEYASAGVRGIKLHPLRDFSGNAINDRQIIYPLIEEVEEHHLIVLIHSGNSWNCTPSLIGDLAADFPNVRFVIAHCGEHGGHAEACTVLKRLPNTYVDIADVYPPAIISNVVRAVGSERVLYGSDHPATPMQLEVEKVVKYCGLSPEELENVLAKNLLRLLDMEPPPTQSPVVSVADL